jgi:mannose-6-phosphate isomerase-like protein (cupin superfamily)
VPPLGASRYGSRMPRKINLVDAFGRIEEHYQPRIAGEINEFQVKIVKVRGKFVWHHHEEEDELFLVVKGRLLMHFRDGDEWIEEGEMIVVPHGVEHCPDVPDGEAHVLLIERAGTPNTGSAGGERTVEPIPLERS